MTSHPGLLINQQIWNQLYSILRRCAWMPGLRTASSSSSRHQAPKSGSGRPARSRSRILSIGAPGARKWTGSLMNASSGLRLTGNAIAANIRELNTKGSDATVEAVHPYFQDYFAGLLNISRPAAKSAIYYKGEGGAALNKFIGQLRKETQPDWMILKNIPVLPPGLRPIVYTADRGVVSSDLNELYKNLIKANNKLQVLKKAKAPSVIIQHASRLLQRAIDHLFWNGYGGAASVTDYLNDELGKFWMKYCDYSGLANVAPDVALGKDECGLRRDALVELYQPLVIWRLKSAGIADRIKSARKLIEDYQRGVSLYEEIITDELEKAIASRPLIITCGNRVTALWPKIRPYEAIGINPEMCRALGLALDGRKVGIHLPLAEDAVIEAKSFIGRVLEGTGEIASVFSGLFTCTAERQRSPAPAGSPSERVDNSPKPLIDAVIAGKSLPLSKLDRYIVS